MISFIASLLGCSVDSAYKIKDGSVYFQKSNFKDFSYHKDLKKLDGADANTFQVLKGGNYAKDNRSVFYEEKLIGAADAASFECITELMGKDKKNGYFMETRLAGSDGASFIKLAKMYARDQTQVYYGKQIIKGANATGFQIVDEKLSISRDDSSYFKFYTRLPVKDYQSFTQVSWDFWKDKYHVYYISNPVNASRVILSGVDPESVKAVNELTIKDKYGCHNGYERVTCH